MEINELLTKIGSLLDTSLPMEKRENIEAEIDKAFSGKSIADVATMVKPAIIHCTMTTMYGQTTKVISIEVPKQYLPENHTDTDNNTIDYILS